MPTQNTTQILLHWYDENKRDLPWRNTTDPYRIWISEIILQQTRVAQGLEYFQRFLQRFPDLSSLATAPEDEVMTYWQGLGYYSRARNLHAAAQEIHHRFNGIFPSDYRDVLSLKGIGSYTAAAICSFAWKQPYAVVDGNVYRVLARLLGIALPIDSSAGKKYFAALAQELLDRRHPDLYNQAMMDFGALQCVPQSPDCPRCPLAEHCVALANGTVQQLPVKEKKTIVRPRYFNYLHLHCGTTTLLARRNNKDIWQNLYEYPLIETTQPTDLADLQQTETYRQLMDNVGTIRILRSVEMPKHILSHRIIYARFHEIEIDRLSTALARYLAVPAEQLENYAVSRLISLYREKE
ncbi:MAG: A/G-specific adenine glycosylase [Odoribacter sp.]